MSDNSGIKAGIGQFAQDVGEALVEPVKDQVGEAIEEGVQAVTSTPKLSPQDPQVLQQQAEQAKKQEEDAKKLQAVQQQIAGYEKIEEEIVAIRMKKKQDEEAKKQEEQVEKQEKGFELQKQQQKSVDIATERAERSTENKNFGAG